MGPLRHRRGCLELYYCNMVEWSWWDSSLIWKTNWLPSVLWHTVGLVIWPVKIVPDITLLWWDVKPCSINQNLSNLVHFGPRTPENRPEASALLKIGQRKCAKSSITQSRIVWYRPNLVPFWSHDNRCRPITFRVNGQRSRSQRDVTYQ